MRRVVFPESLSLQTLKSFANALFAVTNTDDVTIDFHFSKWLPPFEALIASSHINRFKAEFPGVRLTCANYERQSYGAHMGFFQSFGLRFGNQPGQARGGENYLPITLLNCEKIREEAIANGTAAGAIVEREAERLAFVLVRRDHGDLYDTLAYSMREILRNVVEHSQSDRIAFCAQYWPTKNRVEVGVNDWGVGLAASLRHNRELEVTDDESAARLALMPGVSGKGAEVKRMRKRTEWTNSGYGLYMTSRICRNGGTFVLASGTAAMVLDEHGVQAQQWRSSGTAVKLALNTSRLGVLPGMLTKFREEAYEFREELRGEPLTASMASRMLSRDFSLVHCRAKNARLPGGLESGAEPEFFRCTA